jgi:hypothetical protein
MSQGGDKVIKINVDLFKFANNNTRKNKPDIKKEPKPIKMKSINRDKTIKRDMLRRIRANQAEQYDKMFNSDKREGPIIVSPVKKFETEFNDTMDFMNKLVDKHKREKDAPKHNHTVRSNVSSNLIPNLIPSVQTNASSNVSSNLIPNLIPSVQSNLIPSVQSNIMTNALSNVGPNIIPNLIPSVQTNLIPSVQSNVSSNLIPNLIPSAAIPMASYVPNMSSNLSTQSLSTQNPIASSAHVIPPQPTYGCLKNGSLPTYRSAMNKTAKNITTSVKPQSSSAIERIRARLQERANRQIDVKIPKAKPNKIIRRTYNVGKDKFRPVVGVLLPNRTIRNNVANKAFKFKHTPVEEIRKFLLRNGFIKVGSTSPNDVLYKMYESIMLIDGEVKNHNPDNLLYNFFNDKTP